MSLHSKLAEVMGDVKRIPKNGRNQQQGYSYVTESDLADAIREQLSKRGIMLYTSVVATELSQITSSKGGSGYLVTVRTRHEFADGESGETYAFDSAGSGTDFPGDKAIYKALTGAVKYALMKTFLVPTGDDPEADTRAGAGGRSGSPSRSRAQAKPPAPAAPSGSQAPEPPGVEAGATGDVGTPPGASASPDSFVTALDAALWNTFGDSVVKRRGFMESQFKRFGVEGIAGLTEEQQVELLEALTNVQKAGAK